MFVRSVLGSWGRCRGPLAVHDRVTLTLFLVICSILLLIRLNINIYSNEPEIQYAPPIPPDAQYTLVLFVAKRAEELGRTLASLKVTRYGRKIRCYFSIDMEVATIEVMKEVDKVSFCQKIVLQGSYSSSLDPTDRFLSHWWWTNEQVFDEHREGGEIVFLEDDLVMSPDFYEVLDFLQVAKKKPELFHPAVVPMLRRVSYGALSDWSGQHLVNGDPRTFVVRYAKDVGFPTMGYFYNYTFWRQVKLRRQEFFGAKFDDSVTDWSEALQILANQGFIEPIHLLPTFSRVWHVGANSTLQNFDRKVSSTPPWSQSRLEGHQCWAPHCIDYYKIKQRFRDKHGVPCVKGNELCTTTLAMQHVLDVHWIPKDKFIPRCIIKDDTPCPLVD